MPVLRFSGAIAALLALALGAAASAGVAIHPAADPVFQRMLAVNHDLRSYTAQIEVRTRIGSRLSTLRGTVYAKGDRTKIRFDGVRAPGHPSVRHEPSIGAPSMWSRAYAVSIAVRDRTTTIFHLVPRAKGTGIDGIDVTVANATGLVQRYLWTDSDGTTIASDQHYEQIGGHVLPRFTQTQITGRGTRAESETTFSNYRLNAGVPDSVFESP